MNDKQSNEQFDLMWQFLQMGRQKANYPLLKEYCLMLRDMMMQKTGGQRKDKPKDIPFEDIETIKNIIVMESLTFVLSGEYERK